MPDIDIFLEGDGIFETDVVGESHYQDNLERICGPRSEDGEEFTTTANLVFEDSNPYDHQAIRVDIEGKTVGYIMREQAPGLRRSVTSQLPANGRPASIQCAALIVGGWDRGGDDRGHYGVRLDIRSHSAAKPVTSKPASVARTAAPNRALNVDAMNMALADRVTALAGILKDGLAHDPRLEFAALRLNYLPKVFAPPAQLQHPIDPPDRDDFVRDIKPPGKLAGLLRRSWQAYESALQVANLQYESTAAKRAGQERERQTALATLQAAHETEQQAIIAEVERHNQELAEFETAYLAGDPAAISRYHQMVIKRSPYPTDLPIDYALEYQATKGRLVIAADMPGPAIVPSVVEYKYIKSRNEIEDRPRKASEIKQLYQSIVAAIALRTISEAFRADQAGHLAVAIFDGTIEAIDAGTGQRGRQTMVWLQVTRQQLGQINLAQADPSTCVKQLGGRIVAKLPSDTAKQG